MKLFNIITTSLLGMALAIGTGFAVSQRKAFSRAEAAATDGTECTLWTSSTGYQAITDYTTSADGAIKWKNSASNTYSKPTRIYANNTFTIEIANTSKARSINGVVIIANSDDYASTTSGATWTATAGSASITATASGSTVTATVTGSASAITIKSASQMRWDAVTVYYEAQGGSDGSTIYDVSIGDGASSPDSASNARIVWSNIAGLTISQNKGSSNNAPNTSYNTPSTVRFYVGNVFAFVADTANGYAMLGVKFVNSTSSSYYGGTYHANTTWSGIDANITTDDTSKLTLTNCANTTSGSTSTIAAKDTENGVGAIYLSVTSKQSRPSAITVSYIKPVVGNPTSISCADQTVVVTETINLTNLTTIAPVGATTDLSFAIDSGAEYIDLNTTTGVVTGKKGGNAVVTITPQNTAGGATAIDVNIAVTSIAAPQITVGGDFVIYAVDETNGNYELTGVASNLGSTAAYTGDTPACTYVLSTEAGYFENTVAFKNGSSYLALNSNGNNLHTSNTVNANSSWKVEWDSDTHEAVVTSAAFGTRSIQFNYNNGNSRFACYASENVGIGLYPYNATSLTDFSIESMIAVYKTGTKAIKVTYTPNNAMDKTLTWSSAKTSVATVDNTGVVTGVSVGTATISASKVINGVTVTRNCTVTVLSNELAHRGTAADPITVEEAVNVAKQVIAYDMDGNALDYTQPLHVAGIITAHVTRTTSQLTFWIGDYADQKTAADGALEIFKAGYVYGEALATYYEGFSNNDVAHDFEDGYKVLVKSTFTVYNGTPETEQGEADIVRNNFIEACAYAQTFLDLLSTGSSPVCDAEGDTDLDDLQTAWALLAVEYNDVHADAKELIVEATAKTNGDDVQQAVALYDYIAAKYTTQLESDDCPNYNFMGRTVNLGSNQMMTVLNHKNNTVLVVVIVSIMFTVSSAGLFFFIRKRREY